MTEPAFAFESASPEATEAFGAALMGLLPPGAVVALHGDLAAGKTCMVRGMAQAAGGGGSVHSPTFTLVNEYGPGPDLYHLDLYRLGGPDEVADLGYEELFDGTAPCVVEWAERAEGLLPSGTIRIHLAHGGGDRRTIRVEGVAASWEAPLRAALGV